MSGPRARSGRAGLTLIEAALALALLGLIAAASFTAGEAAMTAWEHGRRSLAAAARQAGWQDRLRRAFAEMVPIEALPAAPGGPGRPFFAGDERGMLFVTSYSPFGDGRSGMRLVALRVEGSGPDARAVLREAPCPAPSALGRLLRSADIASHFGMPAAEQRAVSGQLARWSFRYLAGKTGPGSGQEWLARWEGRSAIPKAVRLTWTEPGPGDGDWAMTAPALGADRGGNGPRASF